MPELTIDEYVNLPYRTEVHADTCDGKSCCTAYNPELQGCMAWGWTWQDAVASLKDARRCYIAVMLETGIDVPIPPSLQSEWKPPTTFTSA